ncbi:MAG TPA: GNAT family N-acetyltransferase [Allosphingosinicella sp.]|jgi:RimJ/RimL family protein N-acetyltransferase|nr:GNAT family N-acetyltransferase [Allosphingosinicella sp.]
MFARTERLLLRPGWSQDAPALFEAIGDERIVRNLATAPWPYRPADAEAFLATERKASEPSLLILRRTGEAPELIGGMGFGRRPTGELEFGYWIARRHWGRGYATEAGRAVLAAARHSLRLKRLDAGHFLDNPASGRVLEKLGFRPTGMIVPHFSAGRGETALCRLFRLDLDQEADIAPAMAA